MLGIVYFRGDKVRVSERCRINVNIVLEFSFSGDEGLGSHHLGFAVSKALSLSCCIHSSAFR